MFTGRPREPEWVSWLLVGLWTLAIFATVPIGRAVQELVTEHFGRPTFGVLTLVALAATAAVTIRNLVRRRLPPASYLWLALVAAVVTGYTIHLWVEAEEALHFIQYGGLGVLAYRALCHRLRDVAIYPTAWMIGAIAGMLDEILQWLVPDRFWSLRDIWINFLGTALALLAIHLGLRPTIIAGPPSSASLRVLRRTGLLWLAVVAVSWLVMIGKRHGLWGFDL